MKRLAASSAILVTSLLASAAPQTIFAENSALNPSLTTNSIPAATPAPSASPQSSPLAAPISSATSSVATSATAATTPAASPTPFTSLPEPTPPPPNQTKILFLPPPMDGDISLGIFDANDHLVRTLKREADLDEFGKAFDGLIAYWDGKDDSGKLAPAGKYEARGFTVGDMDFEGVDTFGNDWFTDDDSPRIRRIENIFTNQKGEFVVHAQLEDGKDLFFQTTPPGDISTNKTDSEAPAGNHQAPVISGEKVIAETFTSTGNWEIVRIEATQAIEVHEYRSNPTKKKIELFRRLTIDPNDPQPVKIAASQDGNTIYLLEENEKEQRLRCLQLEDDSVVPTASATPLTTDSGTAAKSSQTPAPSATPQSSPLAVATNSASHGDVKISKWREVFSKTITFSDDYDEVKSMLKFGNGKPFAPVAQLTLKLTPNPLLGGKTSSITITAGFDADGSFLKTTDGLELVRISDTPNLKWVRIGQQPGSRALTIFQSDGAVIEEYRLDKFAKIMSFDAGDFEFKPKSVDLLPKPAPSASPADSKTR